MSHIMTTTTAALNPNAQPWFSYLPHLRAPTANMALSPVAVVVPYYYYYYYRVAPVYQTVSYYYYAPPELVESSARVGYQNRSLVKRPMNANLTTVMIRNIPNKFSRHMLVDFLDQLCNDQNVRFPSHAAPFEYDFLYLPMDFVTGNNLGYAFVNFTNAYASEKIWFLLNGYKWGPFEDCNGNNCESAKTCEITWADIQGKRDLVRHFQKSRFACSELEYLPVVFTPPRNGATSLIPPTTVGRVSGHINHPLPCRRIRSCSSSSHSEEV